MLFKEIEKQGVNHDEIREKIKYAYLCSVEENFKYEIIKFSFEFNIRHYDGNTNSLNQLRVFFDTSIREIQNFAEGASMVTRLNFIWSEFETYVSKDKAKMEEIMERVVRKNSDTSTWILYLTYEKYFGDKNSIRKIYKRAIEYSPNDKQLFSDGWNQYEKMS
jgi:hypothetical protein